MKAKRLDPATRVVLVVLSRLLDWRALLTVVQPDTLIRWHREGWRLLWRWKSRPGRPPIPSELQPLILSRRINYGEPVGGAAVKSLLKIRYSRSQLPLKSRRIHTNLPQSAVRRRLQAAPSSN